MLHDPTPGYTVRCPVCWARVVHEGTVELCAHVVCLTHADAEPVVRDPTAGAVVARFLYEGNPYSWLWGVFVEVPAELLAGRTCEEAVAALGARAQERLAAEGGDERIPGP